MFPRVPIFDLDGTWWCPDMYELWGGGGAPFRRISGTDSAMIDKGRNAVQLLGCTMRIVSELWHSSQYHNPTDLACQLASASSPACAGSSTDELEVAGGKRQRQLVTSVPANSKRNNKSTFSVPFIIAAASTCDEPRWAQELLHLFHTRPHPFDKPVLIHDELEHNCASSSAVGNGKRKTKSGGHNNDNKDSSASTNTTNGNSNNDLGLDGAAIHISDGASYGGGGVVTFKEVLGQFDEVYKANKRTHMANILQKFCQSKMTFSSSGVEITPTKKEFFVPPIFAAALPEGTAVCPQTGLVTFTNPATEAALRQQLEEEDSQPISYKDFIFFDNQMNNIHDVSRDNITSVYVPEGMTMSNWEKGLRQWRREQRSGGQ